MMKFYFFLILLMFLTNYLNNLFMMVYMFLMLMLLILLFILNINFNFMLMNIYSWLGMDYLSMILIVLSIFIISLMYLVSLNLFNKKLFSLLLLFLLFSLMLSFNSMNYFLFYLFFEISLIPTFLLIMCFGYQPERLMASMYMMFYTLFASLPLMIIIFYMQDMFNSLYYLFMFKIFNFNLINNFILYFYLFFAFFVKLPLFLFHMWLPKAHVEAPISGSMILAGVMLKLGGYGIYRSMNILIKMSMKYNLIFIMLSIMGSIILSLICLRQIDLKMLVAYSSVVHMCIMLMGMMTMFKYGMMSSILMMVGHGLCSPGLFMLVNYFYIRSKSRNMYINKGLINIFPSIMLMWFLFCIANMSSPLTLNLISELFIMFSMFWWMKNIFYLLFFIMFFSASYSLYLFSLVFHGCNINLMKNLYSNKLIEYFSLFLLIFPLNIMILKMNLFI